MNDTKILDRVLTILESSGWVDAKGDWEPFEYVDIKFNPSFFHEDNKKSDEEKWMDLKRGMGNWIKQERAEEALREKIRLEVAKQIKKLKLNQS